MSKQSIRNKTKIKVSGYQSKKEDHEQIKSHLSKIMSREIKWVIISIFFVIMIMISTAYAIFTATEKSKNYNTLTVGTLQIDFSENEDGNVINLNGAYPETDEEGEKESPYEFVITNTGTLDASYKIRIINDTEMIEKDNCQDNLLDFSDIKVKIGNEEPFLLSDKLPNEFIIKEGVIAANSTASYSIRMWIKEDASNNVLGKHYHGKIVIDSVNLSTK